MRPAPSPHQTWLMQRIHKNSVRTHWPCLLAGLSSLREVCVSAYVTVFDIRTAPHDGWTPAIGGVIALALIVVMGLRASGLSRRFSWLHSATVVRAGRITLQRTLLAAFCVWIVSGGAEWGAVQWLRSKLSRRLNEVTTIEGVVDDFVAMPWAGHAYEHFKVGGVSFQYSDYVMMPGFHQSQSHGGPLKQGARVRIEHLGNDITKLEINPEAH
jgi:hypothetical protein